MMKRMMYKLWWSVCDYVCVFVCLSRKVNLIASGRGLRCVPRCSKRLLTSKHCDGCATNHILIFDVGTKTNLCYCQAPRVAIFLSGRSPIIELLDLSKLRDVEKNPNVPTLTLSDGGVLRSYTWQRSGGLNQSKIYTRRILHLWPQFFSHTNTLIQGDQMKLSILIFAFLKLNVWNTRHKKMMMMVAAVVGKNVYRGVTWLSRDSTGRGR